ncbi:hypothetical protein [Paraflavitalea speifideaquila]|uniref:hypothetical protein n=1 Tax=Paraflavitalea speifideaquila TaxID=3076558 RepID=UPI0028E597FD|nr:hypothetical protein [Paraflavitalea speifideiaquila]
MNKPFNRLVWLSNEARQHPMDYLKGFFMDSDVSELRSELWEWLVSALSSNDPALNDGISRANLLWLYKQLNELVEASYLVKKQNLKSQHMKEAKKNPLPSWCDSVTPTHYFNYCIMKLELIITLNDSVFLTIKERSIRKIKQFKQIIPVLNIKFPKSEGYDINLRITCTQTENVARGELVSMVEKGSPKRFFPASGMNGKTIGTLKQRLILFAWIRWLDEQDL